MNRIEISGMSDVGQKRKENQDCFLIERMIQQTGMLSLTLTLPSLHINQYGLIVALADGMGGHQGGSFASRIALENFSKHYHDQIQAGFAGEKVMECIESAIRSSHQLLLDYGDKNPEVADMGTTIVGLCIRNDAIYAYHAGDSRLYRFRNGFLMKLTVDHSLVQELVDAGQITVEEQNSHQQKNIITNCLGGGKDKTCTPEIKDNVHHHPGDIFLLCSDGLSNPVKLEEMENILKLEVSLAEKAKRLIQKANDAGGDDNITVVLCSLN